MAADGVKYIHDLGQQRDTRIDRNQLASQFVRAAMRIEDGMVQVDIAAV